MHASVVDLRYRMKDVIRALNRNESVTVLYHGKAKGTIHPLSAPTPKPVLGAVERHPFFGMTEAAEQPPVETVMEDLRGPRHDGL